MNIHEEIKKLAPVLNKAFLDGDMYWDGIDYKERCRINTGGGIVLINGSDLHRRITKLLKDIPSRPDRHLYTCYSGRDLRKAGLID